MADAPNWRLDTLAGCGLAIGRYPRFSYNAVGGVAHASAEAGPDNTLKLSFSPARTRIPALTSGTTRFLGLPLPPGLRIGIEPDRLEGLIDPVSGAVELQFQARFRFELRLRAAELYSAPDLLVDTTLTTGAIQSERHHCQGRALNGDQPALLVGVARIEPCGAGWLDRFLGLPDEALALLEFRLSPEP